MKKVVKFIAFDGEIFEDYDECATHEANVELAKIILTMLPKRPPENFEGYIQHDLNEIRNCKEVFLSFLDRYNIEDISINMDNWYVYRHMEHLPKSIYKCWYRFLCTDKSGREWSQPFYAINPDKGVPKEWKL